MHQLSIIVPLLGHQASFEETLVSVLENRPRRAEVVMACPADYSDPYGLEGEVRMVRVHQPHGWISFANAAALACHGDIIHWLWPGARVQEGWNDAAVDMLQFDDSLASVAPILDADGCRWAGVAYLAPGRRVLQRCDRCRLTGEERLRCDGPSYLAGWYRRDSLFRAGGWDVTMGTTMADIDLALRLRGEGELCQLSVSSSIEFPQAIEDLPIPQGFEIGRASHRMRRRHAPHMDWQLGPFATPRTLFADLFRWPPLLGPVAFWSGRVRAMLQRDDKPSAWTDPRPADYETPATQPNTFVQPPRGDGRWDGEDYLRQDAPHSITPPRNSKRRSSARRESERR